MGSAGSARTRMSQEAIMPSSRGGPSKASKGGEGEMRGRRALATGVVATMAAFLLFLLFLLPAGAATADTGGYPNADMPCEWSPQASSGPPHTKWCQDFDWGPAPCP